VRRREAGSGRPGESPARKELHRDDPGYETDLTDADRGVIAPLRPAPNQRRRARMWHLREIMIMIPSL